jgi:hypothetical protein
MRIRTAGSERLAPRVPDGVGARRLTFSGHVAQVVMPRTVWSGAVSFGLVTVPIHVVSTTADHSVHFHQAHLDDMARISVRKSARSRSAKSPRERSGRATN